MTDKSAFLHLWIFRCALNARRAPPAAQGGADPAAEVGRLGVTFRLAATGLGCGQASEQAQRDNSDSTSECRYGAACHCIYGAARPAGHRSRLRVLQPRPAKTALGFIWVGACCLGGFLNRLRALTAAHIMVLASCAGNLRSYFHARFHAHVRDVFQWLTQTQSVGVTFLSVPIFMYTCIYTVAHTKTVSYTYIRTCANALICIYIQTCTRIA